MIRKYRAVVSIGLVLIGLMIILFYYQPQLRQNPKVYNLTIETEDFRINDIEFVTYADSLYTSDHYLEIIGKDKRFSGVSYGLSIDGDWILSLNQGDDPFTLPDSFQGKINYNTRNLFQGIKVRDHDTVYIEIMYEVNGVTKNLSRTVKVGELIKSFSSTDRNLIQF